MVLLSLPFVINSVVPKMPATVAFQTQADSGLDLTAMDRTVVVKSPTDLPKLAYGTWLSRTNIPPDKSEIGNFDIIQDNNLRILKRILERASGSRSAKPNTSAGRVGLFYRVAMDRQTSDRLGLRPISRELREIQAIRSRSDIMRVIGDLQSKGVSVGFLAFPRQDDLDENKLDATFMQGGQIFRDRTVYWSEPGARLRRVYLIAGTKFFQIAGSGAASAMRTALSLQLETKLARASSTPVELRDPASNYHLMTQRQFYRLTSAAYWKSYAAASGFTLPPKINVCQPKFFQSFGSILQTTPLSQWRSYLTMQLLYALAPYLSDEAALAQFSITSAIEGEPQREARWKRAIESTDQCIGEALGPLYVQAAFSPEAKAKIQTLVHNLLTSLGERIAQVSWMEDATKKRALAKLAMFRVKVGYPDKWRDYSALHLRNDSWARNVMRSNQFEWHRQWAKLGKPIDRTEWGMSASTVNAYYNEFNNEIVFPAGILQPGFYDPKADDAANYGSVGMVIGHEITHGFDDQGSQYNGNGRRTNWWTPADRRNFKAAGDELVKQYSEMTNSYGAKVNGNLTLGENMADVGGLAIAHMAYEKSLGGRSAPEIDGFTGEQRFFIAASQAFKGKYRKEIGEMYIASDPHSPDDVRSFVPSSDQASFYKAFGLDVPAHLPHVW